MSNEVEDLLQEILPANLAQANDFAEWYGEIEQNVQTLAFEIYEKVGLFLEEEAQKIQIEEGVSRDVWSLSEPDYLYKKVNSLRSKIARQELSKRTHGEGAGPRLSEEDVKKMVLSFPDLGRFRIICSFLDDLERAKKVLFQNEKLLGEYEILKAKDYIHDLDLRHPQRGHRAYQFSAKAALENGEFCHTEIQLMTLLQHSWDRRNHPFYEWTREGRTLPGEMIITDVALSETLYLVDKAASENWRAFLKRKQEQDS